VLDDNVCPCTNDPETTGGDTLDGATTGGGLEAAATRAVGADSADVEPYLLDAVTDTCSVAPTSAAASRYDDTVAPEIATQLFPPESQRCQLYAYERAVPDQLPGLAVSVCPCCAVPETIGGDVFVGACFAGGLPAALETKKRSTSASGRTIELILAKCSGVGFMRFPSVGCWRVRRG
jgi:hypothetical protein